MQDEKDKTPEEIPAESTGGSPEAPVAGAASAVESASTAGESVASAGEASADSGPSPEGLDPKSILEAVLYMEDKPVSLEYLSQIIRQSPARTRDLMEELRKEFLDRGAGVQINEIAHGYILSTAGHLGPCLKHFYMQRNKPAFSRAAVEVLAIIAYKQPITRLEIESIRGAGVGSGHLRVLLERKLIRIAGRKNVVGHPLLYATTKEFLLYFGLKNLDSLPTIREIREMEIT